MSNNWKPYRPNKNFEKVPFRDLLDEIWNNGGPWAGIDLYMEGRKRRHRRWWFLYLLALSIVIFLAIGLDFINLSFWQDFLSNGLATLIGAVIGIPIAFYIERRVEKKRDYERKKELLEAIIISLEENLNQIEIFQIMVDKDILLNINLDISVLEATMILRYDVIHTYDLNLKLDRLRFLIGKAQKGIDLFNQLFLITPGEERGKDLGEFKAYIISEVKVLEEEINSIMFQTKGEYYHTVESIRLTTPEEKKNVGKPIS